MKVKSLSCVQLLATPWTAAYQAPLPVGFSRHLGSNPVSMFTLRSGRWLLLAFPQLLSSHHGGWQHLQDDSLGSLVVSQGKNLLGAQLLGGFLLWGSPRFLLVFPVPGLTCDNSSQQDSQKRKLKTVWGSHSKAQEMCLLSQRAVLSSSDQHLQLMYFSGLL